MLGNLAEEAFGFLEVALPEGSGEVDKLFGVGRVDEDVYHSDGAVGPAGHRQRREEVRVASSHCCLFCFVQR